MRCYVSTPFFCLFVYDIFLDFSLYLSMFIGQFVLVLYVYLLTSRFEHAEVILLLLLALFWYFKDLNPPPPPSPPIKPYLKLYQVNHIFVEELFEEKFDNLEFTFSKNYFVNELSASF